LFGLINRLRTSGTTIIYISHFLEEVRQIADRFTVLRDGRSVASDAMTAVDNNELIAHMVGRTIEQLFGRRQHREPGEILLRAGDLGARGWRSGGLGSGGGEVMGTAGLMGLGR